VANRANRLNITISSSFFAEFRGRFKDLEVSLLVRLSLRLPLTPYTLRR
jgi:hypothetical protein